jgi:dihydroxyacetone synthase
VSALISARSSDKPTFINIRTTIGFGSLKAGDAKTHGAALGVDDIANIKKTFGLDPDEHFVIPQDVYEFFSDVAPRGREHEASWNQKIHQYEKAYPKEAAEFKLRVEGKWVDDWAKFIPTKEQLPTAPTATRKSAGLVGNPISENIKNIMIGTADLTPSCNVAYPNKVDFQSVSWHISLFSV